MAASKDCGKVQTYLGWLLNLSVHLAYTHPPTLQRTDQYRLWTEEEGCINHHLIMNRQNRNLVLDSEVSPLDSRDIPLSCMRYIMKNCLRLFYPLHGSTDMECKYEVYLSLSLLLRLSLPGARSLPL